MAIVVPALTADEARALTDEVRADARALWAKVLTLYEGGAHTALGYGTWSGYWEAEFGQSGSRGDQLVRAGRVVRTLEAAGVEDLPINDHMARQLTPVYRVAPEDLPDVWTRALQVSGGTPTWQTVADLVEPYRRRQNVSRLKATGARTRQRRNLAGVPIIKAHANASAAAANVADAIDAGTSADVLSEWLEHVTEARALLEEVARKLEAVLSTATRQEGMP